VDTARSTGQAADEAIGIACIAWETVAIAVAGFVWRTRWRLGRARDAVWEKIFASFLTMVDGYAISRHRVSTRSFFFLIDDTHDRAPRRPDE
jgi:hypothetical protein